MPMSGSMVIVTSAHDGQVRLGQLTHSGLQGETKELTQHSGSSNKVVLLYMKDGSINQDKDINYN